MAKNQDPLSLARLQEEIDSFLASLRHPVLFEDQIQIFDLATSSWRTTVQFGKVLFEAWNPERSIARRLERISHRGQGRIRVQARRPGLHGPSTLEFRSLDDSAAGRAATIDSAERRNRFRREFVALLERQYPDLKSWRVSNRSDREHSFSAWYTRGLARRGTVGWAFLGLGAGEAPAAADWALAYGLIWLDWLRSDSEPTSIVGLKLFLPRDAAPLTAHRAACLDPRAVDIEVFAWNEGDERAHPLDLRDFGNVETRLAPNRASSELALHHELWLRALLGDDLGSADVVADRSGRALSLRVLGLEVARVEGGADQRVFFGLAGARREMRPGDETQFRAFVRKVSRIRRARSEERAHELYRLEPERKLESLLVRDVARIDPALSPKHVYPQVPAFAGGDRGVVDLLGLRRRVRGELEGGNRLAVIELKVEEHINLPLQALDYWLRVKWLHERGQFQRFGYFPGLELDPRPPILYLVAPAFRFHSTTERITRYFAPRIEIVKVGLNQSWHDGIKVLFRRAGR